MTEPWTDSAGSSLPGATPEEIFIGIQAEAAGLGFEFCAHGMRMPLPITRPQTTFFANYPPEWLERYKSQSYMDVDPTVLHGMRSSEPVLWSDEFFAKTPELWAEASHHGLKHGWAQSRKDADGIFSMLVLARSGESITQSELTQKEPQMRQLVQRGHEAMRQRLSEIGLKPPEIRLSEREKEVLRWTADGKTSSEISEILQVSERTVNFHVNNLVVKLGACNKINAAVRATMLGLIW